MIEKPNFWNPAPGAPIEGVQERQWAMFTHLSALSGIFTVVGFILGPLIVWQVKKAEMPRLEEVAKEAMNFNISFFIYSLVSSVLMCIGVGLLTTPLIGIAWLILVIMAGIKANDGVNYRYPATIRLIK